MGSSSPGRRSWPRDSPTVSPAPQSKATALVFAGEHPKPDLRDQSSWTRTVMLSASPPWGNPTRSQIPPNPLTQPLPQAPERCHLPPEPPARLRVQLGLGGKGVPTDGVRGISPSRPQRLPPVLLGCPGLCHLSCLRDAGTGTHQVGRLLSLLKEDAQPHATASAWPRSGDAQRGGPKASTQQTYTSPGLWGVTSPASHSKWGHFKPSLHHSPSQ